MLARRPFRRPAAEAARIHPEALREDGRGARHQAGERQQGDAADGTPHEISPAPAEDAHLGRNLTLDRDTSEVETATTSRSVCLEQLFNVSLVRTV